MSEPANKHQDRLIDNALTLLRDAVRHQPSDFRNDLPNVQFSDTNVVVATEYPDGQRSVVAASSVEIVAARPERREDNAPSSVVKDDKLGASVPEPSQQQAQADLVEHALSVMRTASEERASSSTAIAPSDQLPSPESWLDMERAVMRRRVEAFKATQQRFQREREKYCADALAAAQAGNWKSQQT